jgi:hypothetical protein
MVCCIFTQLHFHTAYYRDPSEFKPLVQDKRFVPWLLKYPTPKEEKRCRECTKQELTKLEEAWKVVLICKHVVFEY